MISLTRLMFFIALVPSVVIHEYFHGRVAELMGDKTARLAGRLTLNPIPHIDLFGTIILPLLLVISGSPIVFGWAKPVPINPYNFKEPRKGMMYTGIAGPASNLTMAAAAGFVFRFGLFSYTPIIENFLIYFALINIVLGVFNLVPVPPLDGSRIVSGLLPYELAKKYDRFEQYGMGILMVIFIFFNDILWAIIGPVINFFSHLFLGQYLF